MSFIGDIFGGAENFFSDKSGPFGALNTALANAKDKPTVIDNPPQKPAKSPADQDGLPKGNAGNLGGGNPVTGGGNSLLGGGAANG